MGRLLVVLDLNGTLLQRLANDASLKTIKKVNTAVKVEAKIHGRPVVSRPGAFAFLKNLLEIADVAVWTSAQTKNAVPMVMLGFGGLLDCEYWSMTSSKDSKEFSDELRQCYLNFKQREDFPQTFGSHHLAFLWTQSQCDIDGHSAGSQGKADLKPNFIKDLAKIWKVYPTYHPKNTLIVDDSEKKIPKSIRGNLIKISEFDLEKDALSSLSDKTLGNLSVYLRQAVEADPEDIRDYLATRPFIDKVKSVQKNNPI